MAAALATAMLGTVAAALATQRLTTFVALRGEETGFTPQGSAHVYSTVKDLIKKAFGDTPAQAKVDSKRLSSEGLVAAAVEQMTYTAAPNRGAGASSVLELGSAAAARREQSAQVQKLIAAQRKPHPGQPALVTRHFGVAGVPSAEGITGTQSGLPGGDANVYFIEGRCLLLVADSIASGNITKPVTAGVESIHRRTHDRCP